MGLGTRLPCSRRVKAHKMSEEDSDVTVYEGVCNASEEQNKTPLSSVANGESAELSFSVRRSLCIHAVSTHVG